MRKEFLPSRIEYKSQRRELVERVRTVERTEQRTSFGFNNAVVRFEWGTGFGVWYGNQIVMAACKHCAVPNVFKESYYFDLVLAQAPAGLQALPIASGVPYHQLLARLCFHHGQLVAEPAYAVTGDQNHFAFAPIGWRGCSGSPVVDSSGSVVGMTYAHNENFSLAVPCNRIIELIGKW